VAAAQRYASAGRGVRAYCRATPSTMRRARTNAPLTASSAKARRRLTAEPRLIVARTCTTMMNVGCGPEQSGIMVVTCELAARKERPAQECNDAVDEHKASWAVSSTEAKA